MTAGAANYQNSCVRSAVESIVKSLHRLAIECLGLICAVEQELDDLCSEAADDQF